MRHRIHKVAQAFASVVIATLVSTQAIASDLIDIKFTALPGDVAQMELVFDGQPPTPSGYTIEKPARISLDLPNAFSKLKSKYHKIGFGNARTATVVNSKDRARVIVSLAKLVPYTVDVLDDRLVIQMGKKVEVVSEKVQTKKSNRKSIASPAASSVLNVDFRRGDQADGQVQILLSNPKAVVDIEQQEVAGFSLELFVIDFAKDNYFPTEIQMFPFSKPKDGLPLRLKKRG